MNFIRKLLLKAVRGVAQEEVFLFSEPVVHAADTPIETIKVQATISPFQYQHFPEGKIIDYTKQRMLLEIAKRMEEGEIIRFEIKEPIETDSPNEDYIITAETRVVAWDGKNYESRS